MAADSPTTNHVTKDRRPHPPSKNLDQKLPLAVFSRAEGPLERLAARNAARRSFAVRLLASRHRTRPPHPPADANDDRVAFLESRKAAALGATDEFRKMEGVNIARDARPGDYFYMAMSEVNETMLSNADALEENDDLQDHVRLDGNDYGAVYRMQLEGDYNVSRMEPVVTGGPDANICGGCPYDASPNSKSSVCADCSFNPAQEEPSGLLGTQKLGANSDVDPENTIANPDTIVVMDDGRVIIGEDSGFHENNMIWVYNPDGSERERGRGRGRGRGREKGRGRHG